MSLNSTTITEVGSAGMCRLHVELSAGGMPAQAVPTILLYAIGPYPSDFSQNPDFLSGPGESRRMLRPFSVRHTGATSCGPHLVISSRAYGISEAAPSNRVDCPEPEGQVTMPLRPALRVLSRVELVIACLQDL